jgi:hypothetical protein
MLPAEMIYSIYNSYTYPYPARFTSPTAPPSSWEGGYSYYTPTPLRYPELSPYGTPKTPPATISNRERPVLPRTTVAARASVPKTDALNELAAEFDAFTVKDGPKWLYPANEWARWEDLVAAALRGGHKGEGIWAGAYKPGSALRMFWVDPISIIGCAWDGFDCFFSTFAKTKSIGKAVVGGFTQTIGMFAIGFYYAEPIMYRIMDQVAKALPKVASKGLGRTLIGGGTALACIGAGMHLWSDFVTPKAIELFGPLLDKRLHEQRKKQALAQVLSSSR